MSERHLLRLLQTGDPEAFRHIVVTYQSALLRRAQTLISDRTLGQDAVQETWLAVVRGIRRFEGRSSLKTWLFSILDNRAKTLVKRAYRTVSLTPEIMSLAEGSTIHDDQGRSPKTMALTRPLFSHIQNNQEASLISQEGLHYIQAAIDSLPERQRKVFQLRILGDWSPSTVSRELRISESNQRVLLHRARLALRTSLSKQSARVLGQSIGMAAVAPCVDSLRSDVFLERLP